MTTSTENQNFTYMLRCSDGSLYTGWTNDLRKRLAAHQSGKGAKYTRAHGPVSLVYFEVFAEKQEAQKREAALKKLKKAEKEELVSSFRAPRTFRDLFPLTKKGNCV